MNVSQISSPSMAAAVSSKVEASLDLQLKMLKQMAESQEKIAELLSSAELGQNIDVLA